MRLRFRLGPFTFGKGGPRLSLWKGGTGVSIPLSKRNGGTFGKVKIGPVSAYFGGSSGKTYENKNKTSLTPDEEKAIKDLSTDEQLSIMLHNNGVPWRGIQERLKASLPENLENRDSIAYKLVAKAMAAVFGEQNTKWKTEKRPSRSGNGDTTWIVLI